MHHTETQQSIALWAEETFGPVSNLKALVDRASLEVAELSEAVHLGNSAEIGQEAADIVILLYRLLELNGMDLQTEVDAKMATNRARRWVAKGDGTGRHFK